MTTKFKSTLTCAVTRQAILEGDEILLIAFADISALTNPASDRLNLIIEAGERHLNDHSCHSPFQAVLAGTYDGATGLNHLWSLPTGNRLQWIAIHCAAVAYLCSFDSSKPDDSDYSFDLSKFESDPTPAAVWLLKQMHKARIDLWPANYLQPRPYDCRESSWQSQLLDLSERLRNSSWESYEREKGEVEQAELTSRLKEWAGAIPAAAYSDDGTLCVIFDSEAWFEQASLDSITDLMNCDWTGGDTANEAARFFANGALEHLFSYVDPSESNQHKGCDFECRVEERHALIWIYLHRPAWVYSLSENSSAKKQFEKLGDVIKGDLEAV